MEKLKGEEKQVWERAFFVALAGDDIDDSVLVADAALDVWKERCAPDTDDEAIARIVAAAEPRPVEYTLDMKGNIILPHGSPFDGESYLLHIRGKGWVEGWWVKPEEYDTQDGPDHAGFEWCCADDTFTAELDDAKFWLPLPDLTNIDAAINPSYGLTLTPEEQKLADALPAEPPAMCACTHPIAAHSEHGCHVRMTPAFDSYCKCDEGHGRDFADMDIVEELSVPCQIDYTAPKPADKVAF